MKKATLASVDENARMRTEARQVLNRLVTAARRRIKESKAPSEPEPKAGKAEKSLAQEYTRHRAGMKRVEEKLKSTGWSVDYEGKLYAWRTREGNYARDREWSNQKTKRLVDLDGHHAKAMVDLLGKSGAEASRYVIELAKALDAL